MTTSSGLPSPYREPVFQDMSFRFDPAHRVELPSSDDAAFEETQPFDQVWLWVLMGFELIFVLIVMLASGVSFLDMVMPMGVIGLALGLLSAIRLYTRIDHVGIHFRMWPFHWRWQTIPWDDIDQVYVRKYSPIREYGGWGIRFGRHGKAFNVKGNYGIQIVRKNGKKLLLGTQEPAKAAEELGRHMLLV
jgi:hypothetical protein